MTLSSYLPLAIDLITIVMLRGALYLPLSEYPHLSIRTEHHHLNNIILADVDSPIHYFSHCVLSIIRKGRSIRETLVRFALSRISIAFSTSISFCQCSHSFTHQTFFRTLCRHNSSLPDQALSLCIFHGAHQLRVSHCPFRSHKGPESTAPWTPKIQVRQAQQTRRIQREAL
jgi:hypothetical protein